MIPARIHTLAALIVGALILAACNGSGSKPTTGITIMAAGDVHTCATSTEGTMWCWGTNQAGQLGSGPTAGSPAPASSNTPVEVLSLKAGPVARPPLRDIVAGGDHTCAILSDGRVFCWGRNSFGQLGLNSTTDSNIPIAVRGIPGSGASTLSGTLVAAGKSHTCAVDGGPVACWGRTYGLLPVLVQGISATAIDARGNRTCIIDPNRAVLCWRIIGSTHTNPAVVPGITAKAIAVGRLHTCAINQADRVRCWGENSSGQLGNGTTTDSSVPVAIAGKSGSSFVPAIALAAGDDHTCAIFSPGPLPHGSVECWGDNSWRQTGSLSTAQFYTAFPHQVISSNASAVALGGLHSCARIEDGSVRRMECWGRNGGGTLGNGSTTDSATPVRVMGIP